MWRTGISDRRAYSQMELRRLGNRAADLSLLAFVGQHYGPELEPLLDHLYGELKIAGTYKTTKRGRLTDLDQWLIGEAPTRFSKDAPLRIHDVAASSGIVSADLFRAMSAAGWDVHLLFSDLHDSLSIVRDVRFGWEVVFDGSGHPLQYIGHGFVISAVKLESKRLPGNILLQLLLNRMVLPEARRRLAQHVNGRDGAGVESVCLLHPECVRLMRTSTKLRFEHRNLFEASSGRYHIVRAMNILNPGYFPDERLAAGVRACATSVVEGGLLLVGRNVDMLGGRLRATAFARGSNHLIALRDWDGGTDRRELYLGTRLCS